jgi:hypothetical protein
MTPATNAVTIIVSIGMPISLFDFDKPRIHSNHMHVFHLAQRHLIIFPHRMLCGVRNGYLFATMRCGFADAGDGRWSWLAPIMEHDAGMSRHRPKRPPGPNVLATAPVANRAAGNRRLAETVVAVGKCGAMAVAAVADGRDSMVWWITSRCVSATDIIPVGCGAFSRRKLAGG